MISQVPLPYWRDLPALSRGPSGTDLRLAQPWRQDQEAAAWFSRGAWALAAVVLWWRTAHKEDNPDLWLPDYFCNGSTAPIRDLGVKPRFYPVGEDLRPRWDICREMAAASPPDLFVLTHYFGQPGDLPGAEDFCQETGAFLIEDAAHVLGPAAGIGVSGDFIFYCPRKTFAVPDGAVLLKRNPVGDDQLRAAAIKLGDDHPGAWPWALKRIASKTMPGTALGRLMSLRRQPGFHEDPPYESLPWTPRLSPEALRMMSRVPDLMAGASVQRRTNARALTEALRDWPGCRPFFAEEPPAAPYRFILKCDDATAAAARFGGLRIRGCPVESWPDLAPEVKGSPERHATAIELRATLLFLPVHQSLKVKDLLACCG